MRITSSTLYLFTPPTGSTDSPATGVPAENADAVAQGIVELDLDITLPDLLRIGKTVRTLDPNAGKLFLNGLSYAFTDSVVNPLHARAARQWLANFVHENKRIWGQIIWSKSLRTQGSFTRFRDTAFPFAMEIPVVEPKSILQTTQERPDLKASREWPEHSGKIHVTQDAHWVRTVDPRKYSNMEMTEIQLDDGRKFLVRDGLHKLSVEFIIRQTAYFNRYAPQNEGPFTDNRSFPSILFDINQFEMQKTPRFMIRTYRLAKRGRKIESSDEQFWMVTYARPPKGTQRELLVSLKEEECGKPDFCSPYKAFLMEYLAKLGQAGGFYIVEPIDVPAILSQS